MGKHQSPWLAGVLLAGVITVLAARGAPSAADSPETCSQWHLSLGASSQRLLADGQSSTVISAGVTALDGSPAPDGTDVYFSASLGSLSEPPNSPTIQGEAQVTLVSGQIAGIAVISATVDDCRISTVVAFDARVDAGGAGYLDSAGQYWAADQAYTTGNWGYIGPSGTYSISGAIGSTPDPILYQSERWGMQGYHFAVANGDYLVTLRFAEIYCCLNPGQRVFDVRIEGAPALTGLDVWHAAGGKQHAYDRRFTTSVSDGVLAVAFIPVRGAPNVSAIAVEPVLPLPAEPTTTPQVTATATSTPEGNETATPTPTVVTFGLYVDAGARSDYVDGAGRTWLADRSFAPGGWGYIGGFTDATSHAIAGAADPALYATQRWWNSPGTYAFIVPNGIYAVSLKLAEIYPYAYAHSSVFDIEIQHETVLSNVDIAVAAGLYRAYDVSFSGIVVTSTLLRVDLLPRIGSAKLNAIAIEATGAPPLTSPTPTPALPAATATPVAAAVRVNAGGADYVDGQGAYWHADQAYVVGGWGYVEGLSYGTSAGIAGSDDDALYQSTRWWGGTGTYKFTVANGVYDVTLKLCELYPYAFRGGRVFDVKIERYIVAGAVDILARTPMRTALDMVFPGVVVADGVLQVDLVPRVGSPAISAIEVSPAR